MSLDSASRSARDLHLLLDRERDIAAILDRLAPFVGENLSCDRVFVCCELPDKSGRLSTEWLRGTPKEQHNEVPGERIELHDGQVQFDGQRLRMPQFVSDTGRTTASHDLQNTFNKYLRRRGVSSFAAVEISYDDRVIGWLEIEYRREQQRLQQRHAFFLQQSVEITSSALGIIMQPHRTGFISAQNTLPDDLPCGVIFFNASGLTAKISERAAQLFGLSKPDSNGVHYEALLDHLFAQRSAAAQVYSAVRAIFDGRADESEFIVEPHSKLGSGRYLLLQLRRSSGVHPVAATVTEVSAENRYKEFWERAQDRNRRLADYGKMLLVRTDAKFTVKEIIGDPEAILGLSEGELHSGREEFLSRLHTSDRRRLLVQMRNMQERPLELIEELRLPAADGTLSRCVAVRVLPLHDQVGRLCGYEALAADVTERRRFQDGLLAERRRIEALFEVARSLQAKQDPSLVMLRGLRALIHATESHAGFGCFYDRNSKRIELAAAEGLSEKYVRLVQQRLNGTTSLVRYAVEHKQGLIRDDIQQDTLAAWDLAKMENLRSTLVVPVIYESAVLGAVILFCHDAARYGGDDYDLGAAAAAQFGLVLHQAELYAAERRQARAVASLYRLTRELSHCTNLKEVAENLFPSINSELRVKRLWLGVMNEQRTHLVGHAAAGPGLNSSIAQLQIDLRLPHERLDEALDKKSSVVVKRGSSLRCSGLGHILRGLDLGTFVIAPLISIGQVVGVLILEPEDEQIFFKDDELTSLVSRMCAEMASVIVARRFEEKIAESEKMRMAGLVAAGVAHNFNNLLQNIVGQASLLEKQLPRESTGVKTAGSIIDSAKRGAKLVSQLLNFSTEPRHQRQKIAFNQLLNESRELYRSLIGPGPALRYKLAPTVPSVVGDRGQLQQVVTNLLVNAKDALNGRPRDGAITIATHETVVKAGSITAELAAGRYLQIDVVDNGIGMNQEIVARCFEPFFTTKGVDPSTGVGVWGSGLGLSSAYSIVKQHGGLITVESRPGRGSLFSIFLPATPEEQVGVSTNGGHIDIGPHIITLGLNQPALRSLAGVSQSLGLRAVAVKDPEQAVTAVRSRDGAATAVLADADNLGEKVPEFVAQVGECNPKAMILLVSSDEAALRNRLGNQSAIEVIDKPVGLVAIHALLRKVFSLSRRE